MNTMFILLMFVPFVFISVGLCVLEVYLAKKDNKWYGLILPVLGFVFSLFVTTPSVFFVLPNSGGHKLLLFVFITSNLFTIIYLIIYFILRRYKKSSNKDSIIDEKEVDRMKIEDLN